MWPPKVPSNPHCLCFCPPLKLWSGFMHWFLSLLIDYWAFHPVTAPLHTIQHSNWQNPAPISSVGPPLPEHDVYLKLFIFSLYSCFGHTDLASVWLQTHCNSRAAGFWAPEIHLQQDGWNSCSCWLIFTSVYPRSDRELWVWAQDEVGRARFLPSLTGCSRESEDSCCRHWIGPRALKGTAPLLVPRKASCRRLEEWHRACSNLLNGNIFCFEVKEPSLAVREGALPMGGRGGCLATCWDHLLVFHGDTSPTISQRRIVILIVP